MTQEELKILYIIIEKESSHRHEDGAFGIKACKETIKANRDFNGTSYWRQLREMLQRAVKDCFFNKTMILACWELIGEEESK